MLIGREKEQYILRQALQADRSRFVAVWEEARRKDLFNSGNI